MHIPAIVRLEGPGGERIDGEWRASPIKDEKGNVIEIRLTPLETLP